MNWIHVVRTLLLMALFGSASPAHAKTIVTMSTFLDPTKSGGREQALKSMIEGFGRENPEIKIVVEPQVRSGLAEKFVLASNAGNAPDVSWIANVDATDTAAMSHSFGGLIDQTWACIQFLQKRVPGFEDAYFSGNSHRIGICETPRVVGDYVLTRDDVVHTKKREDGIGKGSHHIDIHQDGIKQMGIPASDGGSYDMPHGMLLASGLQNVYVAGRCMLRGAPAQHV